MNATIKKAMSLFLVLALALGLAPAMTLRVSAANSINLMTAIPDDGLRDAVIRSLPPAVVADPTAVDDTELASIVNLYAMNKGITDLTGIEYLTGLEELDLSGNQISDITALSGFKKLEYLDLSGNQISDITALSGFKNLGYLNLNGNQISDIAPVYSMENLEDLYVADCGLTELDVSGLSQLKVLNCCSNRLTSLNVSGTKLTYLDCRFNFLPSEDAITGLSGLGFSQDNYYYAYSPQNAPRAITVSPDVANALLELDLYSAPTGTVEVSMDRGGQMFIGQPGIREIAGRPGILADIFPFSIWAVVGQCGDIGVAEVDSTGTLDTAQKLTVTAKGVGETEFIVEYRANFAARILNGAPDDDNGEGNQIATSAVTVRVTDSTPAPRTKKESSGSGGKNAATPDTAWLEKDPAATLAKTAKSKAEDYARTKKTGGYGVRAAAWAKLAGLKYEHDTMDGNAVQVRVSIPEPGKITEDMMVSGYVTGADVDKARSRFEKYYKNKVGVIHFDQQGAWGQPVNIAAKVDLTGMDTENLVFYAYDSKTNSYTRIENPAYFIDKNGYLHFTTELAGDIIISDGPLEKK